MKFSIVYKLTFGAALLILVSISVTGWLFYTKTATLLVNDAIAEIASEMRATGDALSIRLGAQGKDLIFLAGTQPIQELLSQVRHSGNDAQNGVSHESWQQRLQVIFKTMLSSNLNYLEIGFIDKDGQEIVSIVRKSEELIAITEKNLQNKSQRDYVQKTLKLPNGAIFLSEINLNREYGKVIIPYQEVLRSATPIYDERSGVVAGVVVITTEIGHVLHGIQNDVRQAGKEVFITNDRGGYLLSNEVYKDYGFDLGRRFRVQEDIPQLAVQYVPGSTNKQVIFLLEDKNEQYVVNFTKLYFDSSHPERFIAVGITEPYSQILAEQERLLSDVVYSTVLLAIVATLVAMFFAYRMAQPIKEITSAVEDYTHKRNNSVNLPIGRNDEIGVLARSFNVLIQQVDEAQKNLKSMNKNLENRVIERTQKLELSELRQRSIVDNMADGLITLDERNDILSFNYAATNIFGYQPEEVLGDNVSMLISESWRAEHNDYLGEDSAVEIEGQRKNGDVFPLEVFTTTMDINDNKINTMVLRDITERKQIDKIKNEFISTVSHELRTPLTSIRGALGLITGGAVGDIPEKIKEMLIIAENNTQRLLFLINDILDIQKMESGQMVFKFQSVELNQFIEQVIQDNKTYAEQYEVELIFENKLDDAYVFADQQRLMQVMANLLSNATKFSPQGGVVKIGVARHGGSIRISVTDEGEGIPEVFHHKLFDKFTQSDASDTRQKGGTGLGLTISKIIMERHQGIIDYVTNEKIGTTFFIELTEFSQNNDTNTSTIPMPVAISKNPCILIVEENHDVAMLLRRMLVVAGYNADISNDVIEARKQLLSSSVSYRLMILNINASKKDGMNFIKELRETPQTRNLPVVIIAAEMNNVKSDVDCQVLDLIDWLKSPIDELRLVEMVKKVAGQSSKTRVLHVEDDMDVQKIVQGILQDSCDLTFTSTLAESNKILDKHEFDIVLLDIGLPDGSGFDLLEKVQKKKNPPDVVIFSAYDVDSAHADKVSAVLLKSDTDNYRLVNVINSVVRNHQ